MSVRDGRRQSTPTFPLVIPDGRQAKRGSGAPVQAGGTPGRPGSPIPDNRVRDFRDDEGEGGVLPFPSGCLCRACPTAVRFDGDAALIFSLATLSDVMPGRVPGIHEHRRQNGRKPLWSWVPGTRPGTTSVGGGCVPVPPLGRHPGRRRSRRAGIGEPMLVPVGLRTAPVPRSRIFAVANSGMTRGRYSENAALHSAVIAGLVPAIHEHRRWPLWPWVPGTRPGMTSRDGGCVPVPLSVVIPDGRQAEPGSGSPSPGRWDSEPPRFPGPGSRCARPG